MLRTTIRRQPGLFHQRFQMHGRFPDGTFHAEIVMCVCKGRQVLAVGALLKRGKLRTIPRTRGIPRHNFNGNWSREILLRRKATNGIRELGADDSTVDRDLYIRYGSTTSPSRMTLANLRCVTHSSSKRTFHFERSANRLFYYYDSPKDQGKTKSRWSSFLGRFKRRKN